MLTNGMAGPLRWVVDKRAHTTMRRLGRQLGMAGPTTSQTRRARPSLARLGEVRRGVHSAQVERHHLTGHYQNRCVSNIVSVEARRVALLTARGQRSRVSAPMASSIFSTPPPFLPGSSIREVDSRP